MRKGIKLKSNITCLRVEVRWSSSHCVFQDTFKQRVSSQVGSGRKKVKTGDQKNKQTKSCELFFADFFFRSCFPVLSLLHKNKAVIIQISPFLKKVSPK